MSALSAFTTQLIKFFEELRNTFPESRELKMGIEAVSNAKKVNPRLILELFDSYVYRDLSECIYNKDMDTFRSKIKAKLQISNNEFLSSVSIIEGQWNSLSISNRETIWKYLRVLCILCEKALTAGGV